MLKTYKSIKYTIFIFVLFLNISITSNSLFAQKILLVNNDISINKKLQIHISNKKKEILSLKIISPQKNYITFNIKSDTNIYYIPKDTDKGFLTNDWNLFKFYLEKYNNKIIDSARLKLKDSEKELFFTVYIDDIGKYGTIKDPYGQFKKTGGKVNIGYQNDDFCHSNLLKVKSIFKNEYIFNHFHAQRYKGPLLALFIYKLISWTELKDSLINIIGFRISDKYIVLFFICSIILFFLGRDKFKKTYLFSIFLFLLWLLLWYSNYLVLNPKNLEVKLADKEWCINKLRSIKHEFTINNLQYPTITRHGWNIPPLGLNKFYTIEMGVLADASLNYITNTNDKTYNNFDFGDVLNRVQKYKKEWPLEILYPLPYYTNILGEINSKWYGKEDRRGTLQLPITFTSFGERNGINLQDKNLIDSLPNGSLISIWGHPKDDIKTIYCITDYIKSKYKIKYVYVSEYLNLYLSYNPRPILIDSNRTAYWAYVSDTIVEKINLSKNIKIIGHKIFFDFHTFPTFIAKHKMLKDYILDNYTYKKTINDFELFKLKNY